MEAHSIGEMPRHGNHTGTGTSGGNYIGFLNMDKFSSYGSAGRGWDVRSGNEMHPAGQYLGQDIPHNNISPYLSVYIWKRSN